MQISPLCACFVDPPSRSLKKRDFFSLASHGLQTHDTLQVLESYDTDVNYMPIFYYFEEYRYQNSAFWSIGPGIGNSSIF